MAAFKFPKLINTTLKEKEKLRLKIDKHSKWDVLTQRI